MPEHKIAKLERLRIPNAEGENCTARFFIRPESRSRPWTWFEPEEVPMFEEEVGWFELERERSRDWRVVRQLPKPASER